MTAQLETQETEVQAVAEKLDGLFAEAFKLLAARLDSRYEAAIEPLQAEEESLREEHAAIAEARVNLERILPARARVAQSEADALTVAGKHEEAQAKLTEAEEAANAPAAMKDRQREISARLKALEEEKRNAGRRVFEGWYAEAQQIIRASEHGFFINLLDQVRSAMYDYQERHGLHGTMEKPYSFLIKDYHLWNLTAPERSSEWRSSQKWYGDNRGGR